MAEINPSFRLVLGGKVLSDPPPQEIPVLKQGGGGGTSGFMEPASKEYVDLKLEAAIGRIEAKLDRIPSLGAMIATVAGATFTGAVAIVGILLAALSFAGDRFDGGIGLADQRQDQIQRDAEQDAIIKRLDALLAERATQPAPALETPSE